MPRQPRGGFAPCTGRGQLIRERSKSKPVLGCIKAVTNKARASRACFTQVMFLNTAEVIARVLFKRVPHHRTAGGIAMESVTDGFDCAVYESVSQSRPATARSERLDFCDPILCEKIALSSSAQHLANRFYRKSSCVLAQCMGDGLAYVVGRKNRLGGPFGNVPPAPQHRQASMRSITHGESPCQNTIVKVMTMSNSGRGPQISKVCGRAYPCGTSIVDSRAGSAIISFILY